VYGVHCKRALEGMVAQEKRTFDIATYLEAIDATALESGVGPVVDLSKIRIYLLYYMKGLQYITRNEQP